MVKSNKGNPTEFALGFLSVERVGTLINVLSLQILNFVKMSVRPKLCYLNTSSLILNREAPLA